MEFNAWNNEFNDRHKTNNNNGRTFIIPYKTTIISIIDIFGDSIKPAHIPQEKVHTVNTNR